MTMDPVPAAIVTVSLAALWLTAAVHKLADAKAFADSLAAYRLLPQRLTPFLGRVLPIAEIALAVGLLFGRTQAIAGALGGLLLVAYGAAIAVNLGRGRRELDCGCLAFGRGARLSGALVWRNALLAIASFVIALAPRTARQWGWIDAWTTLGGFAVAALLYVAAEELRAVAQRLPRGG